MADDEMMYQIKVTLNGIRPPVWRRLLVLSSLSLRDVHDILQVAIGWTDSHLHQFVAKGTFYGEPDPEFGMERLDETRVRLDQVLRTEKNAMTYEYDFGDSWQHKIVLEKVLANPEARFVPSCLAGARACPPEDCGGIWGYANLLKIISDSSHPEHAEMLEWLGDEFDPERFDISETNSILARMKRRGLTKRSRATSRKRPAP
ncbi:MAG: plasmid pRiA4b ORF-3 family protein [Betaproteobacteria bacterium]|nr:plasmid pRiA4b ORF-3 family protein [Betaproteobacteria bacterium]